jgi:hypothetical protein
MRGLKMGGGEVQGRTESANVMGQKYSPTLSSLKTNLEKL